MNQSKQYLFCTQSFLVCITSHHLLDFLKSKFEIIGFIFGHYQWLLLKFCTKFCAQCLIRNFYQIGFFFNPDFQLLF